MAKQLPPETVSTLASGAAAIVSSLILTLVYKNILTREEAREMILDAIAKDPDPDPVALKALKSLAAEFE